MNDNSRLKKFYLGLVFIILYLPIIYLILYAFSSQDTMTAFGDFSLVHFKNLLSDTRLVKACINTIVLALVSASLSTIIASLGAIALYSIKKKAIRKNILSLNNVLLVMPDVMIGASFLILFSSLLPVPYGFWTVLLAHTAFNIPIVVLMVLPRLYGMDEDILRAGEDLGANKWQILNRIIVPIITPGALTGFFMALTLSLDDFGVSFFVTGSGYTTLAIEIYSRVRRGVSLEINALSAIIFFVALVLVIIYYLLEVRDIKARRKSSYE